MAYFFHYSTESVTTLSSFSLICKLRVIHLSNRERVWDEVEPDVASEGLAEAGKGEGEAGGDQEQGVLHRQQDHQPEHSRVEIVFLLIKYEFRKKGKTQTEDYYVVIEEAWKPLKAILLKLYLSLVLLIIVVCDSSNTKSNLLLILEE